MSWFGRKKDKEDTKEEIRDEMDRLEKQMHELRKRLERERKRPPPEEPSKSHDPKFSKPRKGVRVEFDDEVFGEEMAEFGRHMGTAGKELGEYIKLVVTDAMRGANRAMRSVFIGPDGARLKIDEDGVAVGKSAAEAVRQVPAEEAERLLAPLASAERIGLLYLLAEEPRYHQDLMELSGLKPGTLPHHLKQLEEAGYVTQERVRGRYLITIPGRMALKLAEYLHNQMISGIGKDSDDV
ncbi:MAG: ArsR family transcriptional regulator [Candidatus Hermodarchaeia archaeon]|jgi:DNA-binding transcriptional ArsR family regulator